MKLLAFIVLIFLPLVAALPAPVGYVNDFAGVLGSDARVIESYIAQLEHDTSAEIAVVVIPSLPSDYDLVSYGVQLFEEWGIGKKGRDNGVLVLLSVAEKKWRIEVGYGLEGAITDAEAGRIGREYLDPVFETNDYANGVTAAVDALAVDIRNEPFLPWAPQLEWWQIVLIVVVVIIAIVILALTGNIWLVWAIFRILSMLVSGRQYGGGRSGGGGAGG